MPRLKDGHTTQEFAIENPLPDSEMLTFIAREVSIEAAQKVWREFKGAMIYIPSRISVAQSEEFILKNFDGKNVRQLSKAIDMSTSYVYKVLSKKKTVRAETSQSGDLFENK
jgi:Mor family transcriptional regulator